MVRNGIVDLDKEFWIINGAHNLCYVHPAQAGIRSDLHLITSTGRVYSFLLTEISKDSSAEPDLKLFVEPKEESSIGAVTGLQGYVRASEAEAYKKELFSALWVAESCTHAEHNFTKTGQRVGDGRQLQLIGLGGGPRCTEAAMLGV
jgi:hypothetical protein